MKSKDAQLLEEAYGQILNEKNYLKLFKPYTSAREYLKKEYNDLWEIFYNAEPNSEEERQIDQKLNKISNDLINHTGMTKEEVDEFRDKVEREWRHRKSGKTDYR